MGEFIRGGNGTGGPRKTPGPLLDSGGFHSKKPVLLLESSRALLAGEAFFIIGAGRCFAAIDLAHMGDGHGGGTVFGTGFCALD
ncbi:hypothetical protein DFP90_101762 [Aestuariispira insulae]|uniref:Uncharacterized protein n=1 Tax=Aestuariispira insulae TaxID=1461337 RepID=A0A3D9HWS7_9PROT|nr:hypothetical protein DFP90_101762 [Aestuariispira insulae]